MKLKDGHFISIVESTPLVSIDLVIIAPDGKALLGRRLNKPAKDYWFVPGGRIRKNERIGEAFVRICETELGTALPFDQARLLGAYDHIYDDNFSGLNEVNTHYVVLGYMLVVRQDIHFTHDAQHDRFRWWGIEELLADPLVHQNTKNYFLHSHCEGGARSRPDAPKDS